MRVIGKQGHNGKKSPAEFRGEADQLNKVWNQQEHYSWLKVWQIV